jgi:hypothetical protein
MEGRCPVGCRNPLPPHEEFLLGAEAHQVAGGDVFQARQLGLAFDSEQQGAGVAVMVLVPCGKTRGPYPLSSSQTVSIRRPR